MVNQAAPPRHRSARRALRALVVGQTVIGTASWAALIAILSTASYKFHAQPLYMSAIALAWASPALLFNPLIGRSIDTFGPRRVGCIATACSIVVSGAFVFVASPAVLWSLTLVAGLARAFAQTAIDSMPSHMAGEVEAVTTSIWLGFATSVPVVVGPVIAAGAIAVSGVPSIFLLNAVTYGLGLAIIARLHTEPPTAGGEDRKANKAGMAWRGTVLVLALTLVVWISYGAFSPLEVLYVRSVLGRPASSYATIDVFFGVGLVAATLIIRWRPGLLSRPSFVAASAVLVGLTEGLYIGTGVYPVAVVGAALWGIAVGFFGPACRALILERTPRSAHGRAMARWRAVQSFGGLAPPVASGAIASQIGIQGTLLGFASAVVLAGLVMSAVERHRAARSGTCQPV
jgi:MFS family permease